VKRELIQEIETARMIINWHPESAKGFHNLGRLFLQNGLIEEAIENLEKAIVLSPDHAEAHFHLGSALFTKGDIDRSIIELEEAVKLNENLDDIYFHLGFAYQTQGYIDAAIASYKKAAARQHCKVETYEYLADLLFDMHNMEEALQYYQYALGIAPKKENLLYKFGRVVEFIERTQTGSFSQREPSVYGSTANVNRKNIDQIDREIMSAAKSNLYDALRSSNPELPAHGKRWQFYIDRMLKSINRLGSTNEAIYFAQRHCGFDHRSSFNEISNDSHSPSVQIYEDILKNEYPHFSEHISQFHETETSWLSSLGQFRGRLVSNIMYCHAQTILSCLSYGSDFETICEIGAGYGDTTRMWMTNPIQKVRRYFIIDIPSSLFFAEVFLRREFSDIPVVYMREDTSIESCLDLDRVIILCPLHLCGRFQNFPIDLIINTGSMGEMSESWIDFWQRWLQEQNARFFYSHNYFANPIDNLYEGENLFSPRVPEGWALKFSKVNHPLIMAQSPLRNYAEMLFEKIAEMPCQSNSDGNGSELNSCEKVGLNEFLNFSYAFLNSNDVQGMINFIRRSLDGLEFIPKEILFFLDKIRKEGKGREGLGSEDIIYVNTLYKDLSERYAKAQKGIYE
jgi:putative sugar O-methyltransferase